MRTCADDFGRGVEGCIRGMLKHVGVFCSLGRFVFVEFGATLVNALFYFGFFFLFCQLVGSCTPANGFNRSSYLLALFVLSVTWETNEEEL